MKRLLYLSFYFRPDLCAGSFRNSPLVDELANQIEGKEIEIDVLTTSPNRYATFRKDFENKETSGNVTVERINVPHHKSGIKDQILSFKSYFFEVLKRTNSRNYDLVFASSSRFFTAYLGYLIAKRKKIPLYLDIRDLFSETIANISQNWFVRKIFVPLVSSREEKIFNYASHINLISEGFKDRFSGRINANLSTFTHGIDPVFLTESRKNNESLNSSPKNIVYAGNIGEGQGLHKIIPKAANRLGDHYKFTLIGDGGAKDKLLDQLNHLGISNIKMKKPVNRDKINLEYREADILFIHLNDLEIFKKVLPSKVFELAAIEKPILAGVEGYARAFLKMNVKGVFIFNPGDTEGLLQQVREIESFIESGKTINNSAFTEEYSRKKIDQEMASSILEYI